MKSLIVLFVGILSLSFVSCDDSYADEPVDHHHHHSDNHRAPGLYITDTHSAGKYHTIVVDAVDREQELIDITLTAQSDQCVIEDFEGAFDWGVLGDQGFKPFDSSGRALFLRQKEIEIDSRKVLVTEAQLLVLITRSKATLKFQFTSSTKHCSIIATVKGVGTRHFPTN